MNSNSMNSNSNYFKIDFFNRNFVASKHKRLTHILISHLTNKNKYKQFKLVDQSFFLNKTDKIAFDICYRKNIRIYLLFIKVLSRRFQRLRQFDCNQDLSLNNLRPSTTISLFHHNMTYNFDIFDLLKIIKNALFYNTDLFLATQYPKNPYNNKEFSFGNLINIYLFMREKGMNIPNYFDLFKKSGFRLRKFIEENEPYITKNIIESYCSSTSMEDLYGDIIIMLRSYKLKNATIHPRFPKKMIVDKFTTFLYRHYMYLYSHHPILKGKYVRENQIKLVEFFENYPTFGQVLYNFNALNPFIRNDMNNVYSAGGHVIYNLNHPRYKNHIDENKKYKHLNLLSPSIPKFSFFDDLEFYNTVLPSSRDNHNNSYEYEDDDDDDEVIYYNGDEEDDEEDDDEDDDENDNEENGDEEEDDVENAANEIFDLN